MMSVEEIKEKLSVFKNQEEAVRLFTTAQDDLDTAEILKTNPITAILKISSRFAIFKMEADKNKCNDCKACTRACPMDIDIPEYTKKGERVLSTELIKNMVEF